MNRILAVCLCVALVLGPIPRVAADDTDIFGANIQPNILVFIDSSGSMDDYIDQAAEAPYASATIYTSSGSGLPKATGTVYRCQSGRTIDDCENNATLYVVYKNTVALVPNADPPASASAARDSLSTAGKWNGKIGGTSLQLRTGNYLNYHFSPTGGHEKKITVAKRVLTNLINNTDNIRFGLAKFIGNSTQGPGGATIIADVGSSKATLVSALSGITPGGFTPLKGALEDMGKYFKGTMSGKTSPIQYECQQNFIVMMSDGLQNGYGDVRTEATLRYTQDHRSDLAGIQNIVVDTIGFAVPPTEADAANGVLQTAARNGGGQFYSTTSERDLENALEDAIRRITSAAYAFASPVIPTTSASGLSRTYIAAFQTDPFRPFWKGYLSAYQRDATTGQVPLDADGVPLATALVWEAGQQLSQKSASSRTIYTVVGGNQVEFSKTTAAITPTLLGVSSSADRDNLIGFIRGEDSYDENENGNLTEDRSWKLGDIFHSTPVLVTPPPGASKDSSYNDFKTANATRTTILLAGANDGMLHAFRESDGEELWAFVPPDQLDRLKHLAIQASDHPFYVDAGPIVVDVKIGGVWKTIVVFGERRGGRSYHAMDVTTPTSPQYLWSFTDSEMGETWSEPAIGKVKLADGTDRFVAFFGGGYDTAQNNQTGKAVFAIDVATGQKLWEYYNSSASDDHQYMNFSLAANPTAIDLNQDDYFDAIYIGDIGGQLWKFDVSAPATLSGGLISNWTGKRLFAAAPTQANPPLPGEYYPAQAIYAAPAVALDNIGNLWIYFGTGDRNHPNNGGTNRFYGIKDNGSMANGATLTESSLVDVTTTDNVATQGWYFRLSSTEKVLATADVFNKIVFFSSFTPATTSACNNGGGTARLYEIQMKTGYAAVDVSSLLLPLLTTTSSSVARSKVVGTGIPGRPIIDLTESSTSVIVPTTSQQLPDNPAPPPEVVRRILYWKELL